MHIFELISQLNCASLADALQAMKPHSIFISPSWDCPGFCAAGISACNAQMHWNGHCYIAISATMQPIKLIAKEIKIAIINLTHPTFFNESCWATGLSGRRPIEQNWVTGTQKPLVTYVEFLWRFFTFQIKYRPFCDFTDFYRHTCVSLTASFCGYPKWNHLWWVTVHRL